jgi:hypothetical protein
MCARAWNPAGAAGPDTAEGERTMKKDEVVIGGTYSAKVGARTMGVRIDSENARGGWNATGVDSGKPVRIKDVRHLRGPAASADGDRTVERADEASGGAGDAGNSNALSLTKERGSKKVKAAPPKEKVAKAKKPPKEKKPKAMSCLDAAAAVLKARGAPMRCKELVEAMKEQKLWETDAPTPAATLSSALLREITKKGSNARFTKTDRGLFALGGK